MPENTPPGRDYPPGLAPQFMIEWPLTADEFDTNGGNALVPLMGAPIVPGVGFVASLNHNVLTTKLLADTPPEFVDARAPFTLAVTVRKRAEVIYGTETFVCLGHTTSDRPKVELCAIDDPTNSVQAQFCVRSWGMTNVYLGRANWRFEMRTPEMLRGALTVPQGLCFLDGGTLLYTADEDGTSSTILYRVDLTTGEYTGRARSNTLLNCNCLATDPDGNVWGVAWPASSPARVFKIDLATSFATGVITEATTWSVTGDAIGIASIAFATVGGVEYVLLTEFAHTGTARSFVFLRSKMTAPADAVVDRVLKFVCGYNLQGFAQRPSDGMLYASRSDDRIDRYDIAAIITAGVDNTTPSPVTMRCAPAQRCEGLALRPSDGRLWVGTQARQLQARRDVWSHCSIWSCDLDSDAEWNSFLISYRDGLWDVRCNGRLMLTWYFFANISNPALKLAVGASPATTHAVRQRVLYNGEIRKLALTLTEFTAAQLAALEAT
jgi:hypothetical protein